MPVVCSDETCSGSEGWRRSVDSRAVRGPKRRRPGRGPTPTPQEGADTPADVGTVQPPGADVCGYLTETPWDDDASTFTTGEGDSTYRVTARDAGDVQL